MHVYRGSERVSMGDKTTTSWESSQLRLNISFFQTQTQVGSLVGGQNLAVPDEIRTVLPTLEELATQSSTNPHSSMQLVHLSPDFRILGLKYLFPLQGSVGSRTFRAGNLFKLSIQLISGRSTPWPFLLMSFSLFPQYNQNILKTFSLL